MKKRKLKSLLHGVEHLIYETIEDGYAYYFYGDNVCTRFRYFYHDESCYIRHVELRANGKRHSYLYSDTWNVPQWLINFFISRDRYDEGGMYWDCDDRGYVCQQDIPCDSLYKVMDKFSLY